MNGNILIVVGIRGWLRFPSLFKNYFNNNHENAQHKPLKRLLSKGPITVASTLLQLHFLPLLLFFPLFPTAYC